MHIDSFANILIGVSAGGLAALSQLLPTFTAALPGAVVVVQHVRPDSDSFLSEHLERICQVPVVEAADKMAVKVGHIYVAPPSYHLLIEEGGGSFALSVDEPVNYSRPSIDVFFESAVRVWRDKLIGVVLTGANNDGAKGLAAVKRAGGLAIAQDPAEAEYPVMPRAAIAACDVDYIANLVEISRIINEIGQRKI